MTWLRALAWWRHPAMLRTVIVNMLDDDHAAIRGILWRARGPWLILKQCTLVQRGGDPVAVDGEIVVERTRVHFLQVL
jgi:hypothetical protein